MLKNVFDISMNLQCELYLSSKPTYKLRRNTHTSKWYYAAYCTVKLSTYTQSKCTLWNSYNNYYTLTKNIRREKLMVM